MQRVLANSQLVKFYHSEFLEDQIRDFKICFLDAVHPIDGVNIDVGGGVGYFACTVKREMGISVRIIDMDPVSIENCGLLGLDAEIRDATGYEPKSDESIVCFNLILHRLVADTEKGTKTRQAKAIRIWQGKFRRIFVNEYIYESYKSNLSGWLICQITSSGILSAIGKKYQISLSHFVPTLLEPGLDLEHTPSGRRFSLERAFR